MSASAAVAEGSKAHSRVKALTGPLHTWTHTIQYQACTGYTPSPPTTLETRHEGSDSAAERFRGHSSEEGHSPGAFTRRHTIERQGPAWLPRVVIDQARDEVSRRLPAAEPGDTITLSHENAARRLQSRLRGIPRTSLTGLVAPCPSQTAEETRHRGTPCGSFAERMTFLPVDTPAGDLHCRSDLQEPAVRPSRL